jgi:CheY-like chemotaxis protein
MINAYPPGSETPPEAFIRTVKAALENLYDLPALQRSPLAESLPPIDRPGESSGQRLRVELLAAIDSLNPGPGTHFRAPHARTFHLLHLHYVEGMTVQETARELGLSERQAYRDLRQGDTTIAALIWAGRSRASRAEGATPPQAKASPPADEMEDLAPKSEIFDLGEVLERAAQAVARLAEQRSVTVTAGRPNEPARVSADPVLARQILTSLLSQAVQQAQPGELRVGIAVGYEGSAVKLTYRPEPGLAFAVAAPLAQLSDRLGWRIEHADEAHGRRMVTVRTGSCGATILIIDDNKGLVELVGRYLSGVACRVQAAALGSIGIEMAQRHTPDAIILDVMMPEMDGWETLQRLKAAPATAAIPVIICSVFSDRELAFSLGASGALSKPVQREDLLDTLQQLRIV